MISRISRNAVKEGFDTLPAAICYFDRNEPLFFTEGVTPGQANFAATQKSSPFRGSWHAVRRD